MFKIVGCPAYSAEEMPVTPAGAPRTGKYTMNDYLETEKRTDTVTDDSLENQLSVSGEVILDLVARAQKGDDEAFSDLVGIFEKYVYNAACRTLTSCGYPTEAAEDLAQDSFIKAWRALHTFRGECSFTTWLYRITSNTARDYIRHNNRRRISSLTSSGEQSDSSEFDVPVTSGDYLPEDALEKKELITAVRRGIESLPEDQRKILVMRDLHNLPYQVIADKLGLELGTVKSRLSRARQNLKQILKNGNFF